MATEDKPLLVIDKSFTNSVTGLELVQIAQSWTLIAPNAFFFEVLTTDEKSRLSSVRGLPDIRRIYLPGLLAREREEEKPVTTCVAPPKTSIQVLLRQAGTVPTWLATCVHDMSGRRFSP